MADTFYAGQTDYIAKLNTLAISLSGGLVYSGTWSAAGGTYPGTTTKGYYYKINVAGTISGTSYSIGDTIIYNGTGWDKIVSTTTVDSVAGKTGTVLLVSSDVGLGNVDNTSDIDKPISTLVQNALNLKANLINPSFTTPSLGIATVNTINKLNIVAPATSATLDITDTKVVSFTNTLGFSGTDGSVLNIGAGGTLQSGAFYARYTLPIATDLVLGGIRIGTGLSIDHTTGIVSSTSSNSTIATSGILGSIKVGSGLSIDGSGVLSTTAAAKATINSLGVVKVGSGLAIDSNGVLSALGGSTIATTSVLGSIKVGSGLSIDSSGVLSTTGGGSGSGGGSGVVVSGTAPITPFIGQEWFDLASGIQYTYINNSVSGQWIEPGVKSGSTGLGRKILSGTIDYYIDSAAPIISDTGAEDPANNGTLSNPYRYINTVLSLLAGVDYNNSTINIHLLPGTHYAGTIGINTTNSNSIGTGYINIVGDASSLIYNDTTGKYSGTLPTKVLGNIARYEDSPVSVYIGGLEITTDGSLGLPCILMGGANQSSIDMCNLFLTGSYASISNLPSSIKAVDRANMYISNIPRVTTTDTAYSFLLTETCSNVTVDISTTDYMVDSGPNTSFSEANITVRSGSIVKVINSINLSVGAPAGAIGTVIGHNYKVSSNGVLLNFLDLYSGSGMTTVNQIPGSLSGVTTTGGQYIEGANL